MLPEELRGPGTSIHVGDADRFIEERAQAYPNLDRDFIAQLCYELPNHLDSVLPGFDPRIHSASRIIKTAEWIIDNVLYYDGTSILDEWAWHVDRFLEKGITGSPVLEPMIKHGAWSFPPIVVEASFAQTLGLKAPQGHYLLVEGTHRISYLSRLVQLGLIKNEQQLELIEIRESDDT